jgi:hypothetical protein
MEQQESNAPLATVSASGSDVPVPVASPAKRAATPRNILAMCPNRPQAQEGS